MANWTVKIDLKWGGNDWHSSLTSSEQSLLLMLRGQWHAFEDQIRQAASSAGALSAKTPSGLIDDCIVLLRCLVFNRLEEHGGKFLKIARAK